MSLDLETAIMRGGRVGANGASVSEIEPLRSEHDSLLAERAMLADARDVLAAELAQAVEDRDRHLAAHVTAIRERDRWVEEADALRCRLGEMEAHLREREREFALEAEASR